MKEKGITTLVGSNGAGKTTTLNAIAGVTRLLKGRIFFGDKDLTNYPPELRIQEGISLVPEGRKLFSTMTVSENLTYGAYTKKARKNLQDNLEKGFQLFPILKERRKQLAGSLSGGEQQMLAIARGLMSGPKLLMLDEPSLGLMPQMVVKIFEMIENLRSMGITIFIVEQNVEQTLEIADEAYVMENGRITLRGTGRELINNEHVRKAYLGI